jgi:hypothetical protein
MPMNNGNLRRSLLQVSIINLKTSTESAPAVEDTVRRKVDARAAFRYRKNPFLNRSE